MLNHDNLITLGEPDALRNTSTQRQLSPRLNDSWLGMSDFLSLPPACPMPVGPELRDLGARVWAGTRTAQVRRWEDEWTRVCVADDAVEAQVRATDAPWWEG